jgi:hypothetical protein
MYLFIIFIISFDEVIIAWRYWLVKIQFKFFKTVFLIFLEKPFGEAGGISLMFGIDNPPPGIKSLCPESGRILFPQAVKMKFRSFSDPFLSVTLFV